MRKLGLFLLVVGAAVLADEYNANGTIVQGTGIQSATGLNADDSYAIQCPNLDAGQGQQVFYRPGGCTGCVTDAGLGDTLLDFTSNQDPYPVRLRGGMSAIHLRGFNASDAIWCTVSTKSQTHN
jgi:hypothetical protein